MKAVDASATRRDATRARRRPDRSRGPGVPGASGMSSGKFSRSASMCTTRRPRTWSQAAHDAAWPPKLRASAKTRRRGSPAARRSSTARLASREPSSTQMTSKEIDAGVEHRQQAVDELVEGGGVVVDRHQDGHVDRRHDEIPGLVATVGSRAHAGLPRPPGRWRCRPT